MNLSKSDIITKIQLEVLLNELKLNQEQFIDMWILCGWDYTDSIPGVGPMKSYDLIQKYGWIEDISKNFIVIFLVKHLNTILPKKSQNDQGL